MGKVDFCADFQRDAAAQITERGYAVAEVSKRLGISPHSLYAWKKKFSQPPSGEDKDAEIKHRKRELDLSRFRAAPSARLSHLSFESDGLFQPSAECRRRGL